MPNIPVGFAQLNYVLTNLGDAEEMIVTMGIDLNAAESTDNVAILNAAMLAWADAFKATVANSYTLRRVDGYFNRGAGNLVVSSTATAIAMTHAGEALPQNCAYLLRKLTAVGGRTGKGRMYIPGCTEGLVDHNGMLHATAMTALTTGGVDYLTDMSAILGVNSAFLLHAGEADIPNAIVAIVPDAQIATQRRRLR